MPLVHSDDQVPPLHDVCHAVADLFLLWSVCIIVIVTGKYYYQYIHSPFFPTPITTVITNVITNFVPCCID